MDDKEVFLEKVAYKGLFNFNEVYKFCDDYMGEKGYYVIEKSNEQEENKGVIKLKIKRDGFKKATDYYKYDLRLTITGSFKKTYAEKDGKKIIVDDGNVAVKIQGFLIPDYSFANYSGAWSGKIYWRFLRGVYDLFTNRNTRERHENKLAVESEELAKQLKAFFGMSS